ncbi:AsmA family protein, partial [Rhodovulum sp. PH10]|uniref:AsmA family protein n=1 Tax=Rhodovulum sp. PH10 TaxID=1187851 RepID=UPI00058B79E3
MQSTLLGIAIALILALLTALVGPFFVDWTSYRDTIEAEAGRMVGTPVVVSGPIGVRLLPTPSVHLSGVSLALGAAQMSARALDVTLALGPLLRGETRVETLSVDAPQLRLGLDSRGRLPVALPGPARDPERVAIDELTVTDGRVILSDAASGRTLALDKLTFSGDLRSLAGPLRGEGAFVSGGDLYGVRLSADGRDREGGARIRLSLDPLDRPLTIETDGRLRLDGTTPRYDGSLTVTRAAGAALGEPQAAREPWRVPRRPV